MKTQLEVFRLTFTTPLHISNVRSDYGQSERRIHSDTIYSAIYQAWALLGKTDWITDKPEFSISSLFPFAKDINNNYVYFFPKPFVLPKTTQQKQLTTENKKLKKIEFFDKTYFEKFLSGNYNIHNLEHVKSEYLTSSNFSADLQWQEKNGDIKLKLYDSQVVPRIRWSRDESKDSEPFYIDKLYFKKHAGLWFAFIADNKEISKRVESALQLLQDEGLGTDRNVGNGKFVLEKDSIELDLPNDAHYCIALSLYCPSNKEVLKNQLYTDQTINQNVGYELLKRGGWISEPFITYRKKSVYMFQEGSVFINHDNFTQIFSLGNTLDVTPDIIKNQYPERKIFRIGKAMFLPVKLAEK